MLRTVFALSIAGFGAVNALRGPFYALLFYLWIAYFRPATWVWGGIMTELPLSLMAGAFTVLLAVATGRIFRLDGRLLLLGLFLIHSTISTANSPYPVWAWPYWNDFLKISIMSYLLAVLVTDVTRLRLVFLIIALSLGFETTKQGWSHLLLDPGGKNYNPIPFLGDENGVAVGMFMLVPMVAALIATEPRRWARTSLIFMVIGVTYRGISTYSRGGFLTLMALVGLYIVRSKRKLVASIAVVVLIAGLGLLMNDAFWDRINSIGVVQMEPGMVDVVSSDERSAIGRLYFWQLALNMVRDRPWLGVGLNAYPPAYNVYDTSDGEWDRFKSVHSAWFGVLSELGYPGMAMFLLMFGLAFTTCRRVRKLGQTDPEIAKLVPYATAIETSLVAAAVGGSFVIFQYSEMLWHVFGLSIAVNRLMSARLAELEARDRIAVRSAGVRVAPAGALSAGRLAQ